MQSFISRFVSLIVAGIMTLAISTANADVSELPADIQNSLYNEGFLDPNQPIGASAYRDWVAKNPPPWKIGYASSYAGNTWRAAVMDRLMRKLERLVMTATRSPVMVVVSFVSSNPVG